MAKIFMRRFCVIISIVLYCTATTFAQETHWMPDPNLRKAVRRTSDIAEDQPLTKADMLRLGGLVSIDEGVVSLKGLEHAINLEFLHISDCEVSDLTPLAGLKQLRVLKLYENRIRDVTPLAGLVNLKELILSGNAIEDWSPLLDLLTLKFYILMKTLETLPLY